MPWAGFSSDVLDAVRDLLHENRDALGLKFVKVGEQARGYAVPALFVYFGPGGVQVNKESGRQGVTDYRIPVRLTVLTKHATESQDIEVTRILERCLDLLDGEEGRIAGTRRHGIRSPVQVGAQLEQTRGAYDTVGLADVDFFKTQERSHGHAA